MKKGKFNIPSPDMQINFAFALSLIRNDCLKESLKKTVDDTDITEIDKELGSMVPKKDLSSLASHGLRGELVFSVPCLLNKNPKLLGYYRLLLGFSQKAFYTSEFGLSSFKIMEEKGLLSDKNKEYLKPLCQGLIDSASLLINGIGIDRISKDIIDDLTLLTLGPQLRGGANVKKGIAGIIKVFEAVQSIVQGSVTKSDQRRIEITNAAGRKVVIAFSSDPDIVIREKMSAKNYRNVIAIEVKGGTDFSNIHNRVGEAEKSHQKARQAGFVECWTVVNVDRINLEMVKRESPSTNRFYRISHIESGSGKEFKDFRNRIIALTGIPNGSEEN